jgi:hypothetical protein
MIRVQRVPECDDRGLMRGYRAAWLIPLPLAVASWLGAHCLAYWLVSPGATGQMGLHADHGHAYLGYTPAIAVWALALLAAGLLLCVGDGLRGRRPARPPVRLFLLLPPLGFAVQEHLERLIATGGIPHDLMLEPTFVAGIALQLPFALAALLVAHALNAIGFGIGRTLAGRLALGRAMAGAPPSLLRLPRWPLLLTPSVLAPGHGPRAPPTGCGP